MALRAQAVQTLFQECQETHDPNAIVQLLGQHPYHIDALLALFDLHRCAWVQGVRRALCRVCSRLTYHLYPMSWAEQQWIREVVHPGHSIAKLCSINFKT